MKKEMLVGFMGSHEKTQRNVRVEAGVGKALCAAEQEVKEMLHETTRNDDFERNTVQQCWNNVATIRNNVATML